MVVLTFVYWVVVDLCLRVLGAGRQLAKFMELQSLNDLGYPKRYIRTLQVIISCFLAVSLVSEVS